MSTVLQYKTTTQGFTVKDVDSKARIVSGYLSVFGNKDAHNDIIYAGASVASVAKKGPKGLNRIKFLRDHNTSMPVGPFMELEEDSTGLRFVAHLNKTTAGHDLAILYETGEVSEHSIGFVATKWLNNEHGGIEIHEYDLWEGSAVLWAANELAKITELKSKFERIRSAGALSDNILIQVELALAAIDQAAPDATKEKDIQQESIEPLTIELYNIIQKFNQILK